MLEQALEWRRHLARAHREHGHEAVGDSARQEAKHVDRCLVRPVHVFDDEYVRRDRRLCGQPIFEHLNDRAPETIGREGRCHRSADAQEGLGGFDRRRPEPEAHATFPEGIGDFLSGRRRTEPECLFGGPANRARTDVTEVATAVHLGHRCHVAARALDRGANQPALAHARVATDHDDARRVAAIHRGAPRRVEPSQLGVTTDQRGRQPFVGHGRAGTRCPHCEDVDIVRNPVEATAPDRSEFEVGGDRFDHRVADDDTARRRQGLNACRDVGGKPNCAAAVPSPEM